MSPRGRSRRSRSANSAEHPPLHALSQRGQIKTFCGKHNLSHGEFALHANMSAGLVARIVSGHAPPAAEGSDTWDRIERALANPPDADRLRLIAVASKTPRSAEARALLMTDNLMPLLPIVVASGIDKCSTADLIRLNGTRRVLMAQFGLTMTAAMVPELLAGPFNPS